MCVCVCVCVWGGDSWFVPFYWVIYCPVQSLWVVTFESINPQHLQSLKCILNMLQCILMINMLQCIIGFGDYPVEQLDGDAKKIAKCQECAEQMSQDGDISYNEFGYPHKG